MIVYIFVNTNNISFKYSSFPNFSENSFKTVKQHSFKIIHCPIMRQLSKFHLWYMSFPHNFLFNIKEERHYKIKFKEILFVSICFNYTYFICQKTMILFTNQRLSRACIVHLVIKTRGSQEPVSFTWL